MSTLPINSPSDQANRSALQNELNEFQTETLGRAKEFSRRNIAELDLGAPFCIATTGSHARREHASPQLSPVEFMFLVGTGSAASSSPARRLKPEEEKTPSLPRVTTIPTTTATKIEEAVRRMRSQDFIFSEWVQVVTSDEHPLVYRVNASEQRIIPNRLFEAEWVCGDASVMEEFKRSTLKALGQMTSKEKRSYKRQFYNSAKIELAKCRTKTKTQPVNLDNGVLFYNHTSNLKSTKYVFLRPVQYKLMNYMIGAAEQGKLTEQLYNQMPSQISDRIIWMQEQNLIPLTPVEAKELSNAYLQALQWHLLSQGQFELGTTSVQVDIAELNTVAQLISKFIERADPLSAKE